MIWDILLQKIKRTATGTPRTPMALNYANLFIHGLFRKQDY